MHSSVAVGVIQVECEIFRLAAGPAGVFVSASKMAPDQALHLQDPAPSIAKLTDTNRILPHADLFPSLAYGIGVVVRHLDIEVCQRGSADSEIIPIPCSPNIPFIEPYDENPEKLKSYS